MLIQREIQEIINKALFKQKLDLLELQSLLDLRTDSIENYALMAAMRRIPIEGTEFAGSAVVPEIKMAQIMAVVRLAYAHHSATKTFYIHEPSLLGLLAGANLLCAETAANPREVNESGKKGRGFSVESCREILYNAGYTLRKEPNYPGSWFKLLNGKE